MCSDPNSLSMFEKTHLNVVLTLDETYNNTIVRNGTINGFIPANHLPFFFQEMEVGLAGYNDPGMLNGNFFLTYAYYKL